MNTVLMWIGGILVAILTALFAVPHFIDWNGYRGVVEEESSRLLGRDVRVGGEVNVRLLPAPYLRFEKLRIADTSGIAGAPLIATEGFTMWLAVSPLLRGEFVAQRIELDRPTLTIAADKWGVVNWRSLSLNEGVLPFLPSNVALNSVGIKGGTVAAHLEGGGQIARIEEIDGELTAGALSGPYSFRGTAGWEGSPREVRISTTAADAEGRMRLSAQVRGRRGKDTHTLEGQLSNVFEKPTFEGRLDSRLGLDTLAADASADIKAAVTASLGTLKLADIAISFESLGQPQLISGSLDADWGRRHKLTVDLASRWLDLDRLSGEQAAAPAAGAPAAGGDGQGTTGGPGGTVANATPQQPLQTARRLITGLTRMLPDDADMAASLRIDQVNLGGDTVGAVAVAVDRSGGPLQMRSLRAVLPGGARLDFSGEIIKDAKGPIFAGDVYLGGASAARAIRWLRGATAEPVDISDGPFAISSRLRLGTDVIELKDMAAEFSGVPLTGAIDWREGADRKLDVALSGHHFDMRWLGLGDTRIPSLADLLSPKDGASPPPWATAVATPIRLGLKLGKLANGDLTVLDVDASARVGAGAFDIERLRFRTLDGLLVEVGGRVEGLSANRSGSLSVLLEGETGQAAAALAPLLGGESARTTAGARLAGLAPYRLAGTLVIGKEGGKAAEIDLTGRVRGSPISARVHLANGLTSWREAPADITVRIDDGGSARLLAGWLGMGSAAADAAGSAAVSGGAGHGLVKAVGVPGRDLLTLAVVDSPKQSIAFNGKTGFSAESWDVLTGELAIARGNLGEAMAIAGLDPGAGLAGVAFAGLVDVSRGEKGIVLRPRDLSVGGAVVSGRIDVDPGEGGKRRITARLSADRTSIEGLLGSVLVAERSGTPSAEPIPSSPPQPAGAVPPSAGSEIASVPFLPDRPFDLSAADRFLLDAEVRLARLDVGRGLGLDGVVLKVGLDHNVLNAEIAEARTLSGSATGQIRLKRELAGVDATGSFQIAGADLARLSVLAGASAGARPRASGRADLTLTFSGRALSPQALVAVLDGSGSLTLDKARIDAFGPEAVSAAAEGVLTEASEVDLEAFKAAIAGAVGEGRVALGSRKVGLDVVDGAIRIARLEVPATAGTTALTATLDIATLAVDASAEISAVGGEAAKGRQWPPVSVTFAGPIGSIGALAPTVSADALERELTVRKMERNVEELERLRRLDEEAAARERERLAVIEEARRRAEEEAAARAAAAAAAAAGLPPGAPAALPPSTGGAPAAGPGGTPPRATSGWTAEPNAPAPASIEPVQRQPAIRVAPRQPRPQRPQETQSERLQRQLLNQP